MSKKPICEICMRTDCPGWQEGQPVHEYRGKGSWVLGCHCAGCAKARNESGGFMGALADHLASPSPETNLRGDGEAAVIECLAAGQNFVFDPSTNFLHADDGTVQGIRYTVEHGDMPHMPWPASEWAIDRISKLEAALKKVADMLDAEDADLDDAISIASAALTTEGQP